MDSDGDKSKGSAANKRAEEHPVRADWNTRDGMMSEEEVRRLAAEKGKPEIGAVRADQKGQPGPQPQGDPSRRADEEAGPALDKKLEKQERTEGEPQTPAEDWTKYDWA